MVFHYNKQMYLILILGARCEIEMTTHPLCAGNPCQNNGTCHVAPGTNTYQCDCVEGTLLLYP